MSSWLCGSQASSLPHQESQAPALQTPLCSHIHPGSHTHPLIPSGLTPTFLLETMCSPEDPHRDVRLFTNTRVLNAFPALQRNISQSCSGMLHLGASSWVLCLGGFCSGSKSLSQSATKLLMLQFHLSAKSGEKCYPCRKYEESPRHWWKLTPDVSRLLKESFLSVSPSQQCLGTQGRVSKDTKDFNAALCGPGQGGVNDGAALSPLSFPLQFSAGSYQRSSPHKLADKYDRHTD